MCVCDCSWKTVRALCSHLLYFGGWIRAEGKRPGSGKGDGDGARILALEKQLKELGDKIEEEDKTKITSKLEELKEALKSKDLEKTDILKEEVNQIWQEVSTKLYQQTATDDSAAPEDSTAQDVEYEEVK